MTGFLQIEDLNIFKCFGAGMSRKERIVVRDKSCRWFDKGWRRPVVSPREDGKD